MTNYETGVDHSNAFKPKTKKIIVTPYNPDWPQIFEQGSIKNQRSSWLKLHSYSSHRLYFSARTFRKTGN